MVLWEYIYIIYIYIIYDIYIYIYINMVILIGIHFVTCKLRGAQDARGAEDAREEGGHYDAYPHVSLSLRMLGTNIAG